MQPILQAKNFVSSCLGIGGVDGQAPVGAEVPIQGKANMVFSGTVVVVGSAYAVVTATGMGTEMGRVSQGVAEAKKDEVVAHHFTHRLNAT